MGKLHGLDKRASVVRSFRRHQVIPARALIDHIQIFNMIGGRMYFTEQSNPCHGAEASTHHRPAGPRHIMEDRKCGLGRVLARF